MDISINVTIPEAVVEKTIRDIMDNFPEACISLHCEKWDYDHLEFKFYDDEDGKTHTVDKAMLLKAFPLMFGDKWPRGLHRPPLSEKPEAWDKWLNETDATVYDAFVQLAVFGEVLYG